MCTIHDKPVPILTTLSANVGIADSRSYTVCDACGWVFAEFRRELGAFAQDAAARYDPNHYGQLIQDAAGFLPKKRGRSGDRYDRIVLGDSAQKRLKRLALVRERAEAFASFNEFKAELKAAFLAAVEAYVTRTGPHPVSREAQFVLIAECVTKAWRWEHFDSAKAATTFDASQAQLDLARKSVQRWFETYWKGDKRQ